MSWIIIGKFQKLFFIVIKYKINASKYGAQKSYLPELLIIVGGGGGYARQPRPDTTSFSNF